MLHDFRSDLRDAVRMLRRRPGFAALAVVTLAVGMSVNTVAFSAVNALLFKRPAFSGVERLGWVFAVTRGNGLGDVSLPQYEALRSQARTLEAVAAEGRLPLRWRLHGQVDQVWSLVVSANYFEALGVRPEAGRVFGERDRDRDVAVVSHAFWTKQLAAAALGSAIVTLNEQTFAIVGVLPAGFQGPGGLYTPDVWVPLERRTALGLPAELERPGRGWLTLVARLRPGATPARVTAELTPILQRTEGAPTDRDGGIRGRFAPMADGHPELRGLAVVAAIGMTAVAGVLLIACFNVAGLLIARASERRREMAARAALGASPGRLVRQLVTEGVVLASLAGVLAFSLSMASGRLLSAFSLPAPIPQAINLAPDTRSVAFTLLLVIVAGLVPTLLPARHATRADLQQVLGSEAAASTATRGRARGRRVFQACQVAGATMFLAVAALFVGSFAHMLGTDPGFDTRSVLVVTADPETHGRHPYQAEQFFRGLSERLRRDRRVRSAAAATSIPYSIGRSRATTLGLSGQDCRTVKCPGIQMFVVDPGYLQAMRIPIVGGRDLAERDRLAGGGIVISRTVAERLWPGRSPLGETVTVGGAGELAEVVGIAADITAEGLGRPSTGQAYRAMRTGDYAGDGVVLVVGVEGDPTPLAGSIRRAAADLDPLLPVRSVQTMTEHLSLPLWGPRVAAWFLGTCGALALLLATVGLFGVVSYAVAQRTREFGIRLALGANARSIVKLVLAEGSMLTAVGVVAGLLAARGAAAVIGSALVGVRGADWWPYLMAATTQASIALLACAYPARRAVRADVLAVMRSEP